MDTHIIFPEVCRLVGELPAVKREEEEEWGNRTAQDGDLLGDRGVPDAGSVVL
jgi:hypothetical protein